MKWTREQFIPKDTPVEKLTTPEGEAVLYDRGGAPIAMLFAGKAAKPTKVYRYSTTERRAQAVNEFLTNLSMRAEQKKNSREREKARIQSEIDALQVG